MFIIVFLIVYVFIVLAVITSQILSKKFLDSFSMEVHDGIRYWHSVYDKQKLNGDYVFSRGQINKLKKTYMVVAFRRFLFQLDEKERTRILMMNQVAIAKQVVKFKSNTILVYFAYILSKIEYTDDMGFICYENLMLKLLMRDSVYLREYCLKAIYHMGNPETVLSAWTTLSERGVYHSEKLLADGLREFKGNIYVLTDFLFDSFDGLSDCYQISFVNFLSIENMTSYNERLIQKYDREMSSDLQCAIIRLIGKWGDPKGRDFLLDCIRIKDSQAVWETIAVAINGLGNYQKTNEVSDILLQTISSPNWYIRMNSARTLQKIGLTQEEKDRILQGDDPYAVDALEYALSMK